ncbi:BTAD domain-containing putative transcriptional regulator [Geodermatophilus sp. SYSU D01062]
MLLGLVNSLANARDGRRGPLVHLIARPYVSQGQGTWEIADGGKRLVAFLALHRGPVDRRYAAGCLWPTVDDGRAAGNLRSALWRLNGAGISLVRADASSLRLHDEVCVDVHLLGDWAARVISGSSSPQDLAVMPWDIDSFDMLPGWYDDWVLLERERLRQRVFHAMEQLSREMVRQGRFAEAVEAALVTVSAEPLRESGQRVLIEAHLAEGNVNEARNRLAAYRTVLRRELGIEPSASLVALLRMCGGSGRPLLPQGLHHAVGA